MLLKSEKRQKEIKRQNYVIQDDLAEMKEEQKVNRTRTDYQFMQLENRVESLTYGLVALIVALFLMNVIVVLKKEWIVGEGKRRLKGELAEEETPEDESTD